MAFQTRDEAQDKVSRKLDRVLNKPKKYVPLMERNFNDLATLAEQFEWLKRKQRIKDKNAAQ